MGGGGAMIGGSTTTGSSVDTQYAQAKTSVWWDIENCHVPRGYDAHVIAQNINTALMDMDYHGPVSISAYGDTNKIPSSVQQALSSTGIALNHVPAGVKDASDKKILVDMLFWAVDNSPPANYLLISGDRDFSNALHQLRMRRYNILLAQPQKVSAPLFAAAKSVWLWTSLLAGGPALQSADSSHPVNAANAELSKNVFPGSLNVKQSALESSNLGNQKPYAKFDNKFKGKQLPRNLSQSNISRNSSYEFSQLPAGAQGDPGNGSFDISNQMWKNGIPQQNQVLASESSSIQSQESFQPNYTVASSSFFHPSPLNVSTESNFQLSSTSGFPRQPGYAQGKQFKEAPHEFFGNKPKASSAPPSLSDCGPDPSWNNGNHSPNNYPFQYSQPSRPSGLQPPQPTFAPGNLFPPNSHPLPLRADGSPFTSGPPTSIPDIGKVNISDYPNNIHNNPTFQRNTEPRTSSNHRNFNVSHTAHPPHHAPPLYPDASNKKHHYHYPEFRPPASFPMDNTASNNRPWGTPGCPRPSNHLIGNILIALDALKNDKMVPTEANIADCIRYGDIRPPNFNVRMALDSAIEQQMIVKHRIGGALQVFVQKNDTLWKCVNPLDFDIKHPKTTWDAIQKFLSSAGGRSAMMASQCRYHAASILRKSCLEHLVLGEILQILHVMVTIKKWIVTHPSGWQPISITLAEVNGEEAGAKAAT